MITFAICDDDRVYAERLRDKLQEEYGDNDWGEIVEFKLYQSGKEIVENYITDKIDLVFLDIEIGSEVGFDIARELKALDAKLAVVYVTNYENYIFSAFVCRPLGFIRKKHFDRDFHMTMFEVSKYIDDKYRWIEVNDGKRVQQVLVSNIYAVETYGHKVLFVFSDSEFEFRGSFKTVEEELVKYDFVKINRGKMVNLKYVKEIVGKKVILYGGYEYIVSKINYDKMCRKFNHYRMMN